MNKFLDYLYVEPNYQGLGLGDAKNSFEFGARVVEKIPPGNRFLEL